MTPARQQLLDALIRETRQQGPPTYGRLLELADLSEGGLRQALLWLQVKGYVKQPYRYGAYTPTKTPNGESLSLELKIV